MMEKACSKINAPVFLQSMMDIDVNIPEQSDFLQPGNIASAEQLDIVRYSHQLLMIMSWYQHAFHKYRTIGRWSYQNFKFYETRSFYFSCDASQSRSILIIEDIPRYLDILIVMLMEWPCLDRQNVISFLRLIRILEFHITNVCLAIRNQGMLGAKKDTCKPAKNAPCYVLMY